jgi:hypothetical protein
MAKDSPLQENTAGHNSSIIPYALIILFWGITLFYFIALQQNRDIRTLAVQYLNAFYIPHHNSCLSGNIGRFNINLYFYLVIFFSILTFVLFRKSFWKSHPHLKPADGIQRIIIIVFGGMMIFQTMNQTQYFTAEFKTYYGKPLEARLLGPLKETYDFARYCKKLLPGAHNAELITSLDTSKDPGMFTHRALAYYLYPIDIRGIHQGEKNVLIGFKKKGILNHIPKGYQLISSTDESNIIAVKWNDLP